MSTENETDQQTASDPAVGSRDLLDCVALACAEAIQYESGPTLNAEHIKPVLEKYLPPKHLTAPREFFVELDSLLSWVMNRGWVIRDGEDREIAEKLQRQARSIYEQSNHD